MQHCGKPECRCDPRMYTHLTWCCHHHEWLLPSGHTARGCSPSLSPARPPSSTAPVCPSSSPNCAPGTLGASGQSSCNQPVRLLMSMLGYVVVFKHILMSYWKDIGLYLSLLDIGFIRRCWKNLLLSLDSSSWGQKQMCDITRDKEGGKSSTTDSWISFFTSHPLTRFLRWCFDLRFSFSLPSLRAPPPDPPAFPGKPLIRWLFPPMMPRQPSEPHLHACWTGIKWKTFFFYFALFYYKQVSQNFIYIYFST